MILELTGDESHFFIEDLIPFSSDEII